MKLINLSSGSKGNSSLVIYKEWGVLIDCGLSCRILEKLLKEIQFPPENIRFIFISHEHLDHTKGLKIFANKYNITCYMNYYTFEFLRNKLLLPEENIIIFKNGQKLFLAENFFVESFPVSHDGLDTVCFILYIDNIKIPIFTDLGSYSKEIISLLDNSHTIFLESNYHLEMLMDSPRPWKIKQRILGKMGHLSNEDALNILGSINTKNLKNIVIGHISEEANDYQLIQEKVEEKLYSLKKLTTKIFLTKYKTITEIPLI